MYNSRTNAWEVNSQLIPPISLQLRVTGSQRGAIELLLSRLPFTQIRQEIQRSPSTPSLNELVSGHEKPLHFHFHRRTSFPTSLFPSWFPHFLLAIYLKDFDKDHGVCHFAIQLLLFGSKGKVDQSPGHNPRAPTEEQLEIKPLPYSRVKFNPHHVVVKEVSSEFAGKHQKIRNGRSYTQIQVITTLTTQCR